MKPDDFEQKLQRQPLRQVPAEWRGEILDATTSRHSSLVTRRSFLSTFNSRLSTWLWPHPVAWAGLAAVWIFIFAVNFSMRDQAPMMAEKSAPPSPEMVAELRQQQRMLAELIGAAEVREAERPKFAPQPRSERMEFLAT
ncbi:MAG TPA: hypothetical protein VMD27_01800 [Candidatus Aquilonibacter sp.]|nr:hypothetical protein [Candidatus Aquilonibacter sp.]